MVEETVTDEEVEFRLELAREDLEAERAIEGTDDALRLEDERPIDADRLSELDEARFVGTVAVIAAGTLSVIAIRMVTHWLRGDEEGIQIDLRETPPVISRIANVPRGFIVVVDADGTVTTERAEYDDPEDLVPLLARFLGA